MSEERHPDQLNEPEPLASPGFVAMVCAATVVFVASGGFTMILKAVNPVRVRGATRSSKLVWEQRALEVERTVAAQTATEFPSQNSTAGVPPTVGK